MLLNFTIIILNIHILEDNENELQLCLHHQNIWFE